MKSNFVIAQTLQNGNVYENLKVAERLTKRARDEFNAHVVVFPEYFMSHYPLSAPSDLKVAAAQCVDGDFVKTMAQIAINNNVWLIFGMNEKTEVEGDNRFYNTTIILNSKGQLVSTYRKTHMYDAFGTKESDEVKPGDRLFEPIDTPFARIGVFVCYELRFPEVARYEAMKGADILVVPTAWVKGEHKSLHFKTLVTSRAIENTCYVLACDIYGDDCMGESLAVDPMGVTIAQAGEGEELICAVVDTERVPEVRKKLPSVGNRRQELYG